MHLFGSHIIAIPQSEHKENLPLESTAMLLNNGSQLSRAKKGFHALFARKGIIYEIRLRSVGEAEAIDCKKLPRETAQKVFQQALFCQHPTSFRKNS